MGEPAGATEHDRIRRRELAQAIVEAVENDESVADAADLETIPVHGAGEHCPRAQVEERLFALAQEIQQLIGGELYLVVTHDRRSDDQYDLHLTLADANAAVEEFKALYDGEEMRWLERTYGRPKWVRYVDSLGGDGPTVLIQVIGMSGSKP